MEYHLDDVVRQIPGKVTSNCNFASFTLVLNLLDDEHADILRRSCLWPLYSLRDVQFSGQLLDALLCRLLKPVDGDAIHFNFGGKVATFSIFEFALVTGLRCTDKEAGRARIPRNRRLLNEYFHGRTTVTLALLRDAFRECDQMSDKLKLGLVLILESVLRCYHKKTSIDIFHLEVVDDIDTFNNYPWGRRCFVDTLRVFRRGFSMPNRARPERKYDAYGLPLALQIWVYETIPILASRYARRGETRCPRMHHWRAQDKPLAKQLSALLDDPELEVLTELAPSIEEKSQSYIRELFVSIAPDDQMPESSVVRDREGHPVSPPLKRSRPTRISPPSRRSCPVAPNVQMPESRVDRDREGRPVSPSAPIRRASTDDLFELLTEMRGNMAELRDDVAMLRAGLENLHAEVTAIRDDITCLRRTGGYRDREYDGGVGGSRDGGGDGGGGGCGLDRDAGNGTGVGGRCRRGYRQSRGVQRGWLWRGRRRWPRWWRR
ncbi:uncharacterized protein LOC111406240 isoform X1 [Olea europaea var. sylvestris]|uniref:uncharacterized protein LOC111406240 isoform X1 n=2 Tax=Olea europaea var. sylvestris TaxID=158386 RepID=UPI000C1D25E6|nr:uncharacterized protein LOC111406240 isoform X1 [Olea europaea var. sylvestris]